MIRQEQIQDPYGNIVHFHTGSDVVFDPVTGDSVKTDITRIKKALGMISESDTGSGQSDETGVNIDASTLNGYSDEDFVLKTSFQNSVATINTSIGTKAPLDSPDLTGTPTAPDVDSTDSSQKIANTKFVKTVLAGYAKTSHTHAASSITAGTFADTGVMAKNGSDYTTSRIRNIAFIGSSETLPTTLDNGSILLVYEG